MVPGYSLLITHHSSLAIRSQAMTRSVSRREFLNASAATAGIAALSPWAYARILGANDRIRFGMIGLGVMGTGPLHGLKRQLDKINVDIIQTCHVYRKRAAKSAQFAGPQGTGTQTPE